MAGTGDNALQFSLTFALRKVAIAAGMQLDDISTNGCGCIVCAGSASINSETLMPAFSGAPPYLSAAGDGRSRQARPRL